MFSQTWLGRLAMAMPLREGAGLAIVVLGKEVGATRTLTSKNRAPEKSLRNLLKTRSRDISQSAIPWA